MRLDKFLWCVRYFKTRSIAANEIKKNRVKVNGEIAKSSREVNPTDFITVRKNQIDYSFEILQLPDSRLGAKLVSLYIVDKTPKEELEKLELKKLSRDYYRAKGEGRPTKKDRRDLDDFMLGEEDE
ncbi:MAG: RNA-binding S4 domain-containing protein [Weeksellaceae bacterium]|jgi:ribosome-associated heat shock protein Hsp15|nr:RNA-binding S4 domain-containing protein [Weeksellaceae bacterium]